MDFSTWLYYTVLQNGLTGNIAKEMMHKVGKTIIEIEMDGWVVISGAVSEFCQGQGIYK